MPAELGLGCRVLRTPTSSALHIALTMVAPGYLLTLSVHPDNTFLSRRAADVPVNQMKFFAQIRSQDSTSDSSSCVPHSSTNSPGLPSE